MKINLWYSDNKLYFYTFVRFLFSLFFYHDHKVVRSSRNEQMALYKRKTLLRGFAEVWKYSSILLQWIIWIFWKWKRAQKIKRVIAFSIEKLFQKVANRCFTLTYLLSNLSLYTYISLSRMTHALYICTTFPAISTMLVKSPNIWI